MKLFDMDSKEDYLLDGKYKVRGRRMICDNCIWGDCESCPLDEHPTNSEIGMLGVGDR